MSYARTGYDSDVYVIMTISGVLECISCPNLGQGEVWSCSTFDEMIEHLEHHREDGYMVPDAALEQLKADAGWELREAEHFPQLKYWQDIVENVAGGSHRDQELRKRSQVVVDAIREYLRVEIGDY